MKVEKVVQQAVALQQQGRMLEAERLFLKVLKAKPNEFVSLFSMGVSAARAQDGTRAVSYFERAVKVNPGFAQAWYSLGIVLQNLKRNEEALPCLEKAHLLNPTDYATIYALGVSASSLGDQAKALEYMNRCGELNPADATNWYNRGVVLQAMKRFLEAVASFNEALKLNPSYLSAYINRGNVFQEMYRHQDALLNYEHLLKLDPTNAPALSNYGVILTECNRYQDAVDSFTKLVEVRPDFDYAVGLLYFAKYFICSWDGLDGFPELISRGVTEGKRICKSLALLAISDSSQDHQLCSAIFARHWAPLRQTEPVGRYRHDKIRIAYVSPDLREHPVGHLMAGIFENHDKSRFETIAISLEVDDKSELSQRIRASFDHFIDAKLLSSSQLAEKMREMEVDIAVDLAGYTASSRPDLFTYRPAPVQVNYLGYPSTLGTECIDYIVADRWVIPEENHPFFTEKVVYLPDTYLPTDANLKVAEQTPSRADCGLPETGFVFCSFNHSYKINPAIFQVWMEILKELPGSVLWLMKLNPVAEVNLRKEAEKRGVDPARLIFATRVPRVEDHLARYRQADLFLDTTPYNAHTTASDALYMGLPVLTCLGKAFPGRVAASLLNAIGMPELVVHSLEQYRSHAVELARDPAALAALKAKLASHRESHPLFDTKRHCRSLEAAYLAMWEREQRGEAPASFAVDPSGLPARIG